MSDKHMFRKLVFYLEACESGSMFHGMNIPNVYAISAANSTESSWGAYCGDAATVNGQNLNSCLGDLFSVSWMEDSESRDVTKESLEVQFSTVALRTNRSQVMQWGDLKVDKDDVAEYEG